MKHVYFLLFCGLFSLNWLFGACQSKKNSTAAASESSLFEQLEKLEIQNREATDSLEALSDICYKAITSDSIKYAQAQLLKNRTERTLQYLDRVYYQLIAKLNKSQTEQAYRQATVSFFLGENKDGVGYQIEKEMQSYVDDLHAIYPGWNFTSPFLAQNEVEMPHNTQTDLVEAHFEKTFPEAAFLFLSALKKEVVQIELQAINQIAKE